MPSSTLSLVALVACLPSSYAWGSMAHQTVAIIAQNYVSSATAAWAQNLLSDTSNLYMANVATWADSYRYTTAGKWSAPLHFIDAEDNPPSACNVDYNRDCGASGCVVSAISNYTTRLRGSSYSTTQKNEALKFMIHFLGDIHQPLHNEAIQVGGNSVAVTFDSASTNLHSIWDTNMPQKLRGGSTMSTAQSWASDITTAINSGQYSSQKSSWLSGMTLSNYRGSAMVWASDANAYVCSQVMPNGYQTLESGDLGGTYYQGNTATIQLQVAKAGYRLAAWLNLIHDGATGLKRRDVNGKDRKDDVDFAALNGTFIEQFEDGERWNRFAADEKSQARMARLAWEAIHGPGCGHDH